VDQARAVAPTARGALRVLVSILLVGLSSPAQAAISRVAQCSAQTTNCALGATPSSGDVILVFSHRDGSTAAPTLATGYTSVSAAGANTNAARLAYKYSDGTETTSGTWTNASSVAAVVYRGVDPHFPIGGWAVGGGASVTLSFTGFSLWAQNSSSWVAGFAGHRTATNVGTNAPSGMTTQSSATDVAVFDTGAAVNTWSTQTAAVSANSGWRTYAVEIRTAPAADSPPSPDYLVQHVAGSNIGGGQSESTVTVTLPNLTKAGNCLVVSVGHWNSLTASVADDKTNTYTLAATGNDATNGYQVKMFVAPNIAADTKVITVTLNNSGVGSTAVQVAEFYNIATSTPVDVNVGTSVTLPSAVATGSMTTTQANDLVYQVAFSESQFLTGNQPLFKRITKDPTNGLVLASADLLDGVTAQYGIKASAGAINPTINVSATGVANSDIVVTAAVALKTATAGSAGSGKRIVHVQSCNFFRDNGATTVNLQFPSTGNLLVQTWVGYNTTAAASVELNSMTDGAGNTWSATGASVSISGGGLSRMFYSTSPTAYPNLIGPTLSLSRTQQESNGILFDIAYEGKTWALDVHTSGTGTQSVTGNLTTLTVTPTTADGIIISHGGIDLHTVSGLTGTGFFFDAMVYPQADGSRNFYEDNPVGHYFNSDTSARTFVWSTQNNPAGVDGWSAIGAAFKATSGAGAPAPRMLLLGVGGENQ
jgi:hypothetical protein